MGSKPRNPWGRHKNRQATHFCLILPSGAWQRTGLQDGRPPLIILIFEHYTLVCRHCSLLCLKPRYGHVSCTSLLTLLQRQRTLSSLACWKTPYHPQEQCKGKHSLQLHIMSSQTQDRSGRHVAKDRFNDSNKAFQGGGEGVFPRWLGFDRQVGCLGKCTSNMLQPEVKTRRKKLIFIPDCVLEVGNKPRMIWKLTR